MKRVLIDCSASPPSTSSLYLPPPPRHKLVGMRLVGILAVLMLMVCIKVGPSSVYMCFVQAKYPSKLVKEWGMCVGWSRRCIERLAKFLHMLAWLCREVATTWYLMAMCSNKCSEQCCRSLRISVCTWVDMGNHCCICVLCCKKMFEALRAFF